MMKFRNEKDKNNCPLRDPIGFNMFLIRLVFLVVGKGWQLITLALGHHISSSPLACLTCLPVSVP